MHLGQLEAHTLVLLGGGTDPPGPSPQINFFIFIRILHTLLTKLRARQMRYSDYKCR